MRRAAVAGGRRPGRGLGVTAVVLLLAGAVLVTVGLVVGRGGHQASEVGSGSMDPTYRQGDRIVTEEVDGDDIRRGDVVLSSIPERVPEGLALQRVVALGGDRVAHRPGDDALMLNGRPLDEPYVRGGEPGDGMTSFDVTVPEGRMFLLGDNRGNSRDSRYFLSEQSGTVAVGAVRARVLDDWTVPVLLVAGGFAGVVLFLVGGGLGVASLVVGRRKAVPAPDWAAMPPPPVR
ncbi:signal peptidase I [Streptomyces chryseus]|uniref:signal peptidase I n=1 Tax=Streptomyces chryseus TaxID=68186 RepID=UPI001677E0C8|nr:signal peptidase I [Streptomyces chryseus]